MHNQSGHQHQEIPPAKYIPITYYHGDESPIARPDLVGDGNPRKTGMQKLRLIDQPTFSGRSGELLARRNGAFVDLNGNGVADFGVLFSKSLNFIQALLR